MHKLEVGIHMSMRSIGKTGILVSEICLGTGSFGGLGMYRMTGNIYQREADDIVSIAMDSTCRH